MQQRLSATQDKHFDQNELFALYKLNHMTVSKASENRNVFRRDLKVVIVGSAHKDASNEFRAKGADELKACSARRLRVRQQVMNDV